MPLRQEDSWATDVSCILTFGCEVFAWIPAIYRDKCDGTGRRCVYMGPDTSSKGPASVGSIVQQVHLGETRGVQGQRERLPVQARPFWRGPVFDLADKEDGTIAFDFCKQEPPAPVVSVPEPNLGVQIQEVPAQESCSQACSCSGCSCFRPPSLKVQQKVEPKKPSRSFYPVQLRQATRRVLEGRLQAHLPDWPHTRPTSVPENLLPLHHHQPRLLFHPSRLRGSVRVKESSHKLRPQAHSLDFAHLLIKELITKLKEEFNEEDPDDADLDKLISDPSLEPSVCVYTAVADPTTRRQALASPNAEQWQKAMQEGD